MWSPGGRARPEVPRPFCVNHTSLPSKALVLLESEILPPRYARVPHATDWNWTPFPRTSPQCPPGHCRLPLTLSCCQMPEGHGDGTVACRLPLLAP